MNNIIQQITTNIAKKLEKVLINSLNNKYDFSDIVEELTITGKQVTSNMLNYVLEEHIFESSINPSVIWGGDFNIIDKYKINIEHVENAEKLYNKIINEYSDIIKKVMTELVIHNKALEINTKVQNAFKETTHLQNLLMLYKEVGGTKLTLSSDAHTVDRYAQGFEYYSDIIKQCGFSYLCYYIKRKEYHFMI